MSWAIRLARMTNAASLSQRAMSDCFGLARYFSNVLIEGEFKVGKPDEGLYPSAMVVLGVSSNETWLVGENLEWEVAGPQRLGLGTLWIGSAGCGVLLDSRVTPDQVIRSLRQLPNLFGRGNGPSRDDRPHFLEILAIPPRPRVYPPDHEAAHPGLLGPENVGRDVIPDHPRRCRIPRGFQRPAKDLRVRLLVADFRRVRHVIDEARQPERSEDRRELGDRVDDDPMAPATSREGGEGGENVRIQDPPRGIQVARSELGRILFRSRLFDANSSVSPYESGQHVLPPTLRIRQFRMGLVRGIPGVNRLQEGTEILDGDSG